MRAMSQHLTFHLDGSRSPGPGPACRLRTRVAIFLAALVWGPASILAAPPGWQARHDLLVARLRALAGKADAFGPAWLPVYQAALPWYEEWGGRAPHAVDDWMVPPDDYATELADALAHGRNYFADHPGALIPLVFNTPLPGGRSATTNYWLLLPAGFPTPGRTFPLVIGLHGSGWLGHAISFVRKTHRPSPAPRTFSVTPIDEGGPWQIDFLNAFLDRLLAALPADPDRVYVEGHSIGGMATWEWALANPERFAAISPRAGVGEPFRAGRLKHVPAWVIHGARDNVVPVGFADQMVAALQACGAGVRYSVLAGVEHNMPDDLDEEQVVDWYLQQSRSRQPPPPDPCDALGLTPDGFSPWSIADDSGGRYWNSAPFDPANLDAGRQAALALFQKARANGALVDAPLMIEQDLGSPTARMWLAVPRSLRANAVPEEGAAALPSARYLRFYFRGTTARALDHLDKISPDAESAGHHRVPGTAWITPLSLWPDAPSHIAEYRVRLQD